MKKVVFFLMLCVQVGFSQGLVIDHTSVQGFDRIPSEWLMSARNLTMHYVHTSHGMQILAGLKYIRDTIDENVYSVAYLTFQHDPVLPDVQNAHRICDVGGWPSDYWYSEAGRSETRRFARSGLFDFSMFGWCGELAGSGDKTEYVQQYLEILDRFEHEFSNMRFIYMTNPSDGYPSYSKLRQNNNLIREYCADHGKILFDFADIENYDPDGMFYPHNHACSWCASWCESHPSQCFNLPEECNSGVPTCCPHTHGYNCYIKAKAYWYMLARLAGWQDNEVPVQAPKKLCVTEVK